MNYCDHEDNSLNNNYVLEYDGDFSDVNYMDKKQQKSAVMYLMS